MTPNQKNQFLAGLSRNRIEHKELNGGEISILCPECGSKHENRRQTLYVNSESDLWQCWRCSDLKGGRRSFRHLLDVLRLENLLSVFQEDEVLVEEDSLEKARHKLLFGEEKVVKLPAVVELPEGYRTDWYSTDLGTTLYRYLRQIRKFSKDQIKHNRIGYTLRGNYVGSIVLPVYMNNKLVFWQIRRVLLKRKEAPKYDSPTTGRSGVLFGYDSIDPNDCIIVEGIFDAIKVNGTALLSKKITSEQIALLAGKKVKRVTCLLDGEAWNDCEKLANEIASKLWCAKTIRAIRLPNGKDPGELGRKALNYPAPVTIRP